MLLSRGWSESQVYIIIIMSSSLWNLITNFHWLEFCLQLLLFITIDIKINDYNCILLLLKILQKTTFLT